MSMIEVSRCTGACCKDFTLPISPDEIRFLARRKIRTGISRFSEIDVIADMVIFKGTYRASGGKRLAKKFKGSKQWLEKYIYHYTCKHFDAENKLCKNYENRPSMCRSFPSNDTCHYRGCTRRCEEKAFPPPQKEMYA